jgi:hypothetical protein
MKHLEEYFKYHPPKTQERIDKHDLVNKKCLELFQIINKTVENEEIVKLCFYSLQQLRMFANQGITIDELKKERNKEIVRIMEESGNIFD